MNGLTVDLDRNAVSYGGKTVGIPPQECVFWHALAEAHPKPVRFEKFRIALWGAADNEPDGWAMLIKVYASRVRLLARELGLQVVSVYNVGYRLALAGEELLQGETSGRATKLGKKAGRSAKQPAPIAAVPLQEITDANSQPIA